jgi:DNA-binding LacI/PurR family transcriptional regulator
MHLSFAHVLLTTGRARCFCFLFRGFPLESDMPRTLQITKHFHVANKLRELLQTLPPGSQVPTIKTLISEFGASQTTIDRALAQLRREGLVTRPAGRQRLVINPVSASWSRRIALLRADYPSRTFDAVAQSILEQGRKSDTRLDVIHYRSIEDLDISLATGDADGTVVIPTGQPVPAHVRAALERPRKPVVLAQEVPPGLSVHAIHLDHHAMTRQAAQYLISLGHSKIAYFDNQPPGYSQAARRNGWRQALENAGLPAGDHLLCDCGSNSLADALESAYAGFNRWMDSSPCEFTAVLAATGTPSAMAVMRALHERGIKVPHAVSLVSCETGESLGAYTLPGLTTLQADMAAYGAGVLELLDALFKNPDAARRQILLPASLIVRASTAPARTHASVL